MKVIVGVQPFEIGTECVIEFTNLDPAQDHSFPHEYTKDFDFLLELLLLPVPETRLMQQGYDILSFMRLRRLALEICGLKKLDPAFQSAFLTFIQRDTPKATAKAMGFATRDFKTRDEERYVDRSIHRLMRKVKPPVVLELNKVE
jgi:hypothetical protein